jgi:hypothetical protein
MNFTKKFLSKMKIKKYIQYIKEISGTELIGPMGPGYGETGLQNKTVNPHDTTVVYSDLDSRIYTEDEYNDVYDNYLKSGGKPLSGFNKENLDTIISFSQKQKSND